MGGFGLQRGHFSAKMYAKMKELGPVGGRAPGTPPRSAYDFVVVVVCVRFVSVLKNAAVL